MEGLHIIGGLRYDQKELFLIHIITQYYAVKEKRDKCRFAWLIQEIFVVHEQSFIVIVTFVFKRT